MSSPEIDLLAEPLPSRFVVGMDLGTTNSAVAYVDTHERPWRVRTFGVPQIVAASVVETRETLPSFHYQPAAAELPPAATALPWTVAPERYAVGFFARDQGLVAPGRTIASAKSWLCHSGVDRTTELLPWHGAADVERLSPIEASSRYLQHVRAAWNHRFPAAPLEQQDFVLTLPASFDEVARELTVEAARRAGLMRVVLIEEPQAAFYDWISRHAENWESLVDVGQTILVCDVGGGTSDFTLIRVRRGSDGRAHFHRVAVGEHLILGGDNMDLALAQHVERKLVGDGKLESRAWEVLVRSCRQLKETLLGEKAPEQATISLPGAGARLLGGGRQVEVTRAEVSQLLIEGFLPRVGLAERPQSRRSGFQEFGLPYASDPAITRYLAAFLSDHRAVVADELSHSGWLAAESSKPQQSGASLPSATSHPTSDEAHDPARPDVLLFNGGVFESAEFRNRLVDVLSGWFSPPGGPAWKPLVLDYGRLDLAVAHGAAYYGLVRRGEGVRIAADLARTYYIGVGGTPPQALCLVPADAEPGREIDLAGRRFELLVSQPVEFSLYTSSTRLTHKPGELVPFDREQMKPLPPIRTVLRTRRKGEAGAIAVSLHARLSEIGTVEISCREIGGERSWRLEFDVRSATQTDVAAHVGAGEQQGLLEEPTWQACEQHIENTFGPAAGDPPEQLAKRLAETVQMPRTEWPMSLLRRLWEALYDRAEGRRRSAMHESRWLNLLGFSLRPGYGYAVDDWRVAETWRTLAGKLVFPTPSCRAEWWILWRRIAGGLSAGQQRALVDPLWTSIRSLHRRLTTGKAGGGDTTFGTQEWAEVWRLAGALELLGAAQRIELGRIVADLVPKKQLEQQRSALVWALGRLGSRMPVYGPLNTVVEASVAAQWLERVLPALGAEPADQLAVMQLARRTGDRHRDLPDAARAAAVDWLTAVGSPGHYIQLVRDGGLLDSEEQSRVFGEALPQGLRIL